MRKKYIMNILFFQNDAHMYSSGLFPIKEINPTGFEIVFSFFLTILIVYMISNSILSFVKNEVEVG